MPTVVDRFLAFISERGKDKCWIWKGGTNGDKWGYGRFKLKERTVFAHRYAWTLIHGEIPENLCILHKCDNPPCVNPDHLFLGTRQENNDDKMKKGRVKSTKGEQNGNSKLIRQDVHKIRELLTVGVSQREIARQMNVPHQTIGDIARKRSWTHI